jgi:sulfite dehydrogenase (cytochrome) subunit A
MLDRRQALGQLGAMALTTGMASKATANMTLPFANGERPLVKYPQKRPLIRLTTRPPQLETPFAVFNESILTPNDAFFVRYHLAGIPLEIDPRAYRINITGCVRTPLSLSLEELHKFPAVEIVAVHQCSGNSRGFMEPRVGGGQLGHGAMGNARWKGVPLKAVLDHVGVKPEARQVTFNGLDNPIAPETPDFVKALDIDHALDGEVMLAYAMNDTELPFLNGYPVRLVVPGYYGTYWVKHISDITIVDGEFAGYWMKTAYRIPDNLCACTEPGTPSASTVPIRRFSVRSFITNLTDGQKVKANLELVVNGIAFDGGYGISEVLVSTDEGQSWVEANLGEDMGKYAFRAWRTTVKLAPGRHRLMVRAGNRIGQTQPIKPLWNPPGYMFNGIEAVGVDAN